MLDLRGEFLYMVIVVVVLHRRGQESEPAAPGPCGGFTRFSGGKGGHQVATSGTGWYGVSAP